ncbi:hypothetical protein CU098_006511 [Rhizopus stolonifer]|uniref:Uncharacterized protein n=1 Tax=Rhizopus stolonifer TaxID=4846 RepID=A0A367J471_RHIST|nr:hypothetical protein CU098_006511 [Rhizopus stolonifer]
MCLLEEKGSENDTLLLAHVSSSDDQQTFHILQSTNQWRTRKSKNEDFYSELSQIKMDMMALRDTRSNRYLEDQVKILREEMSTMRSFVYNLTDELTKARTINQPSETKQKSINQTPRVLESPLDEVKSRRIFKEDPDMFKEDPDMFKEDQDMFKEDPNMFKEDQDMFKEDENFSLEKDETNLQLSLENFSFPSCQDISSFEQMDVPIAPSSSSGLLLDEEDTLEELAVPTWSDEGKESTTKRTSISADSLWEDTDSSIATSCVTSTGGTPVLTPSSDFKGDRKQNRKLLRMLHQVQADSLVKRELMGRLEKTEDFYAQMRTHYEDKLNQLRLHLAEVQRERDVAIKRKPMSPTASTPMRERPESVLQLRENRQAEELRSEYQVKVKQLIAENHELRKKNTQITQASRMAQIKSDSMVRQLQEEIEKLSKQTKRKSRELKIETDGAKEASVLYEKEIQQLKRREAVAVEAKKKADEVNEAQSQLIKKRSEETATVNTQMRQLVNMLRKSANAGTFLNEANLEKILNGTFIPTPTNVPSRRSATH